MTSIVSGPRINEPLYSFLPARVARVTKRPGLHADLLLREPLQEAENRQRSSRRKSPIFSGGHAFVMS